MQRLLSLTPQFINDTTPSETYTLSLHDALPIYEVDAAPDGATALKLAAARHPDVVVLDLGLPDMDGVEVIKGLRDRKSTRLNSSHGYMSYAGFCLKKETMNEPDTGRV